MWHHQICIHNSCYTIKIFIFCFTATNCKRSTSNFFGNIFFRITIRYDRDRPGACLLTLIGGIEIYRLFKMTSTFSFLFNITKWARLGFMSCFLIQIATTTVLPPLLFHFAHSTDYLISVLSSPNSQPECPHHLCIV